MYAENKGVPSAELAADATKDERKRLEQAVLFHEDEGAEAPEPERQKRRYVRSGNFTREVRNCPEWGCWKNMFNRTTYPSADEDGIYLGSGIDVCRRWRNSFAEFLADMGPRLIPGHSIERTNSKQSYACGKCEHCQEMGWKRNGEWATSQVQARNRKGVRLHTWEGKSQLLGEWAREKKIPVAVLRRRLKRGWDYERAFGTPARPRNVLANFPELAAQQAAQQASLSAPAPFTLSITVSPASSGDDYPWLAGLLTPVRPPAPAPTPAEPANPTSGPKAWGSIW